MYVIAMLLLLSNTAVHPINAPQSSNAAYARTNPASEGSFASAPLSYNHHHSHSGG
jgi:hypothetical protein